MEQHPHLTKLGLFDARVPRYTSYPTAPHFKPAIGPAQAEDWLAQVPPGSAVSLYVHVPFCRRLCWFCACRTQGTYSDAPVRAYADTLLAEIALLRARLPQGVTVSRLHWGGGTPTLMPPELTRTLAAALADAFPLAKGAEFSVEIDPAEIDDARLDALAEAGMTRASIGVQDFDPQIQSAIGRVQGFALTARAVQMIRARGIAGVNADILFGLPHQDRTRIALSVQKLLALSPDRVALYGYAHVPWVARRQVMIPAEALPAPPERLALFQTAHDLFVADGYLPIGIDHFARPGDGLALAHGQGRLRRNFQGYTDDGAAALIGLGASAISRYPQGYAQNAPATGAYTAAIRAGRLAVSRGHALTPDDLWRARAIEALMCDFALSAAEMARDHGIGPARLAGLLAPVKARFGAMVDVGEHGLRIPSGGRVLTRMIAQMFDRYEMQAASHSSAI